MLSDDDKQRHHLLIQMAMMRSDGLEMSMNQGSKQFARLSGWTCWRQETETATYVQRGKHLVCHHNPRRVYCAYRNHFIRCGFIFSQSYCDMTDEGKCISVLVNLNLQKRQMFSYWGTNKQILKYCRVARMIGQTCWKRDSNLYIHKWTSHTVWKYDLTR